jgi:hypothetical protein
VTGFHRGAAVLFAAALLAGACGTGTDDEVTAEGGTSPPPTNETTSTETTATGPAETVQPEPTDSTTDETSTADGPDAGCPEADARAGDLDADGREEQVVHVTSDGVAAVRVCDASGGLLGEIPGLGRGEALDLVDLQGDGRTEILFGSTTAGSQGTRVAVWENGQLLVVTDQLGEPLTLRAGTVPDQPAEHVRAAYGCVDGDADGSREVVQVVATRQSDGTVDWTRRAWSLSGSEAAEAWSDAGGGVPEPADPGTNPFAPVFEAFAPPC